MSYQISGGTREGVPVEIGLGSLDPIRMSKHLLLSCVLLAMHTQYYLVKLFLTRTISRGRKVR